MMQKCGQSIVVQTHNAKFAIESGPLNGKSWFSIQNTSIIHHAIAESGPT